MAHPNTDLITRAYELFGQGDMENLQTLWTDDIVWHIAGNTTISGDHEGAAGVLSMFGQLVASTEGTFQAELQSAMADDTLGFSLHKATAEKGGESYELWTALTYRFDDGKVAEIWNHPYDQALEDKLLA